jgi:hypothetical protein
MQSPSEDLYATQPVGYARSVYFQGQPPALQQPELKTGQQYMSVKHVSNKNYTLASPERTPAGYWDQYPPNDPYWATGPSYTRAYQAPQVQVVNNAPAMQDDSKLRIRIQGLSLSLSLSFSLSLFLSLSLSLSLSRMHMRTQNNHVRQVRSEIRTLCRSRLRYCALWHQNHWRISA